MPLKIVRPLLAVLALVALAACYSSAGVSPEGSLPAASLVGREWRLTELNGRPAGNGAGGRAATLRLEGERAAGFAGCNSFGGGYTLAESRLVFSALAFTRMACEQGMELEREYLTALEAVRSWRMTPQGLELLGESGVLARFAAA
jgi:heat shock protein HslJ